MCNQKCCFLIVFQSQYRDCRSQECIRGDLQLFYPAFKNTTHSVLTLHEPVGLDSGYVNILNGSDGTSVSFKLISTDTIGKLKQEFLKMKPDFKGSLNLAYNGKPVKAHQTMAELRVKSGTNFITFQRCHGGQKDAKASLQP